MYSRLVHLAPSVFVKTYATVFDNGTRDLFENVYLTRNLKKWVNQPFAGDRLSEHLVSIFIASPKYSQCVVIGDMRWNTVVVAFSGGFNARCAMHDTVEWSGRTVPAGPHAIISQLSPLIQAAVACVKQKVGATRVVVTGASLGGTLATLCALQMDVECVVFSCPFMERVDQYVWYNTRSWWSSIRPIATPILHKVKDTRITLYGMSTVETFRTLYDDISILQTNFNRVLLCAQEDLHPDKPTKVSRWTRSILRTWKNKRRSTTKKWRATRIYRKGI